MSDERTRKGNAVTGDSFQQVSSAGLSVNQSLVLSAYIDERRKWEENKLFIEDAFYRKHLELREAYKNKNTESSWKYTLYNRILKKATPCEQKVDELAKELDVINSKLNSHLTQEPDVLRYELAALGGNLFKPRY